MDRLNGYIAQLEDLARRQGLDYWPVEFQVVPPDFMMEVAVYGLPVRMPHWSFGVRYIYQLVQHQMGNSKIFEVVYPGNPGRAYLANTNTIEENTLVAAHVLGHADFSRNNSLFRRSQEEVGYHIVEQAAVHARQIGDAIDSYGQPAVEAVLDAALALEQHIDLHLGLRRERYPERMAEAPAEDRGEFMRRFDALSADQEPATFAEVQRRPPVPPHPEQDLLWFIANYAPEMEGWERDIFLAVREESFYFYPVFACQIMNEGWASFWHARLLRDADFLPSELYLQAAKTHSDVVRPYAGEHQVSLQLNPYHLGFSIWERIVKEKGMEAARRIMEEEDDFGFIRNHLDEGLARELKLFEYGVERDGRISVAEWDINQVRELILAPKFNFGAPRIAVVGMEQDGALVLHHDHATDRRGLDLARAQRVLEYLHKVWRRPVRLHTVDSRGEEKVVTDSAQ